MPACGRPSAPFCWASAASSGSSAGLGLLVLSNWSYLLEVTKGSRSRRGGRRRGGEACSCSWGSPSYASRGSRRRAVIERAGAPH